MHSVPSFLIGEALAQPEHIVLTCVPGPLLLTCTDLILTWKDDYKFWHKSTYPFPNLIGSTIDGWENIYDFVPYFIIDVITNPCRYHS